MSEVHSGQLPVGYRLEEFELQGILETDSSGVVYQAWDHKLNRPVTIKGFLPGGIGQPARDGLQGTTGMDAYQASEETCRVLAIDGTVYQVTLRYSDGALDGVDPVLPGGGNKIGIFYLPAGLFRRMAAMTYDGFLLLALLFMGSFLFLIITHGQAVPPALENGYRAYLLIIAFLFYGWFWTHGGQTLGMRAWKIRLQRANGQTVGWSWALLRFVAAMLTGVGLGGLLWIPLDGQRRALQDLASGTVVVQLE